MTTQPTPISNSRALPAPFGWADHRTRTVALNAWLAREDAVASGAAAPADPQLLGLPDRDTLLRALFQRFATTLEGVLDNQLELGAEPGDDRAAHAAIRAAYRKAVAHRPGDWRALQREADDPVVVELTRRQHARVAARAGVAPADVSLVATELARVDTRSPWGAVGLSSRSRRRRTSRVLARRAG